MTVTYADVAVALGHCTFLPGSWDKRFSRDLASVATRGVTFSEAQENHLLRLAHKYRRQMPARILEGVLDLAEGAANRRSAAGKGALADFSPTRKRKVKAAPVVPMGAPLPLLDRLA